MDGAWTSRWNLRFDDAQGEQDFCRYHELTSLPVIRAGMGGAILLWLLVHAAIAVFAREHLTAASVALCALYPVLVATWLLAKVADPRRNRHVQMLVLTAHSISFTITITIGHVVMRADLLATVGFVSMLYQVASIYRHRTAHVAALLAAASCAYLAVLVYLSSQGALAADLRWVGPLMVAVTILQGVMVARGAERALREVFLKERLITAQQEEIRAEKARSETLLLNVLPESIAAVLRERPGIIAEEQREASVLFADLAGFTAMSSRMSATEVVDMLNGVFTAFDGLVDKYGLEKIKTIGDCYMVAAGVPVPRADHAVALVSLALEMRDLVASTEFCGRRLQFRFGVNSGPVVAGVIGRRKFIYDLWGDTVNLASRMESNGHAGVVQISEATLERVEGAFDFEAMGVVVMKGKGEVPVFHVHGRRTLAA